jgi:proline-specific peptidase
MSAREGFVPIGKHKVWYREVGSGVPVVFLHGGPGAPCDYLESLEGLASDTRRVIRYDQLGCGRSDKPSDGLWRIERFVEELETVRRGLGLERFHLLGQSWGGMLAIEYVLAMRPPLEGLVLASTLSNSSQWAREADRLRAALPPDVQSVLKKHEAAGTTDDPEYRQAMMEYYRRHLCRLDPWPDCALRSFAGLNQEVYGTMWGPSEFYITGNLKDWDRTDRLAEINVPTLVTCGRHDEATPTIAATLRDGIPGAELVVFEDSSHMAHEEEKELFLQTVAGFLDRVESRQRV